MEPVIPVWYIADWSNVRLNASRRPHILQRQVLQHGGNGSKTRHRTRGDIHGWADGRANNRREVATRRRVILWHLQVRVVDVLRHRVPLQINRHVAGRHAKISLRRARLELRRLLEKSWNSKSSWGKEVITMTITIMRITIMTITIQKRIYQYYSMKRHINQPLYNSYIWHHFTINIDEKWQISNIN